MGYSCPDKKRVGRQDDPGVDHAVLQDLPFCAQRGGDGTGENGAQPAHRRAAHGGGADQEAMAAAVKKYGPLFVDALELYCASFREALAANLSEKEENDPV